MKQQTQLTQEALKTMKPEQMQRLVLAIFDRKNPGSRKERAKKRANANCD